jgi:hypothetical protein
VIVIAESVGFSVGKQLTLPHDVAPTSAFALSYNNQDTRNLESCAFHAAVTFAEAYPGLWPDFMVSIVTNKLQWFNAAGGSTVAHEIREKAGMNNRFG